MSWKPVVVVSLTVLAGTVSAGAAAPDLTSLAEALAAPRVGAPVAVEEALEVGRGTIAPAPGTAVHVLTAEGIPCGLWVKGPATFTYRVEDRFSRPVAQRNLKNASRLSAKLTDSALVITAEVREAVVWGWDLPAPEVSEETSALPFSPWARGLQEESLDGNPVRDMLLAHFNGQEDYRHAWLRAGSEDLVLDVDGRPHVQTELLMRLERLRRDAGGHAGRSYLVELAVQPFGRSWWDPVSRPFTMTDVDIRVTVKKGPRAKVRSRVRVESTTAGLSLLALGVPENVMDEDRRLRPVSLHKVGSGDAPLTYFRRRNTLFVALPEALAPGAATTIETEIEGDFALRPGKDLYWTMSGAQLFPTPRDNGLTRARYELNVEVPSPFIPLASGTTQARESGDGTERLTSRLDGAMMSPALTAGKYRTVSAERGEYKVNVSSYAQPKKAEAKRLANNFFAAKECYETWFGVPYPFKELEIVEINSWGFGVAPPGVIYVTRELFGSFARTGALAGHGDFEGFLAAATSRGANERFVHEVAHGYFPHVAWPEAEGENWLSESLAEYVSAVCTQRISPTPSDGNSRFQRALAEWKAHSKDLGSGASLYLAEHLAGEDAKDSMARYQLLYGKGPLVLHAIRQELGRWRGNEADGDQYFFAFFRAIVRNFTDRPVGTRHLVGILEQMTGTGWQPFFERYVYGTETPKLN